MLFDREAKSVLHPGTFTARSTRARRRASSVRRSPNVLKRAEPVAQRLGARQRIAELAEWTRSVDELAHAHRDVFLFSPKGRRRRPPSGYATACSPARVGEIERDRKVVDLK